MLKTLLEQIAAANDWRFLYGTAAMFNIDGDKATSERPILFMTGFGKALGISYDRSDAAVPTYRVDVFLVVHSQLPDLADDRTEYFDYVEELANKLSKALYKAGTWTGENRSEVINVNDVNVDGLRITGSLTVDGFRLC